MWGTSSHIPPLRLQRLGCVSVTFTQRRSQRFTVKGEKKTKILCRRLNSQLGLFCKRPLSHAGCATQSELRKSGRAGDVFGFLTVTTQPGKNSKSTKHFKLGCFRFLAPGEKSECERSGHSALEALRKMKWPTWSVGHEAGGSGQQLHRVSDVEQASRMSRAAALSKHDEKVIEKKKKRREMCRVFLSE